MRTPWPTFHTYLDFLTLAVGVSQVAEWSLHDHQLIYLWKLTLTLPNKTLKMLRGGTLSTGVQCLVCSGEEGFQWPWFRKQACGHLCRPEGCKGPTRNAFHCIRTSVSEETPIAALNSQSPEASQISTHSWAASSPGPSPAQNSLHEA